MSSVAKIVVALAFLLAAPFPVEAYLGPGGVVSGVGALLALGAAVLASVFGFVWFPVKRLIRRLRSRGQTLPPGVTAASEPTVE